MTQQFQPNIFFSSVKLFYSPVILHFSSVLISLTAQLVGLNMIWCRSRCWFYL